MNKDDQIFIDAAYEEALLAFHKGEVPVGAVIVHENQIIGRGHNLREQLHDPTAHAEIIALKAAGAYLGSWRLHNCDLYVTHEPCPMCAGALMMAEIHAIIYGCDEPKTGACGSQLNLIQFPGYQTHIRIRGPVDEFRCAQLMQDFFKHRRF